MRRVRGFPIIFGILLLLLLVHALVLSRFMSFVHGDAVLGLSAWASVPPTIDGVIDEVDWASAASVAYTTEGGVSGVFYVMNDAVNLYIAVITTDPTLSMDGAGTDKVFVYFDNDHEGDGPESGDDIFGWTGYLGEGFRDGFSDGTYVWRRDTDYGGTSDGSADATNNGTHNHFEIMHPLNTADDFHDFSLRMSPGDTVGFAIRLVVDGGDRGFWPSDDPSAWSDITVFRPVLSRWARTTPMVDGKLSPSIPFLAPGEWDDADRIDFVLSWGAESHNASLYVKNDYINLYLAFEIQGEDYNGSDRVVFNFDNNNDGTKASRDNQLFVEGWHKPEQGMRGFFHDAFFPFSVGSSECDITDAGGVKDGVGATGFTGPEGSGSYAFEVAYPLNTTDNGHDFSLGVNDTVGFNVLYEDAGGPLGDGWPTFTEEDWFLMAEIEIATPRLPPGEDHGVNLKIDKIEITQAIQWLDDAPPIPPWNGEDNSVTVVRGKSTVVRVYVDVGTGAPPVEDVTVYLYATDGISGLSLAQPGTYFPNGPLYESFDAPVTPDRGNENHTANFLLPQYWVERVGLTLVTFVKAPTGQGEADYTDNWMSRQTFSFTLTKSLEIGYYRIDYRPTAPDENPNLPSDDKLLNGKQFFEKVTPIPDLSYPIIYYELGPPIRWELNFTKPSGKPRGWDDNVTTVGEILNYLNILYEDLLTSGDAPDHVAGLFANAITRTGWARVNGTVFIAHEDRPWSFAHEAVHNYNLNHSWVDPHPWAGTPEVNSSQAYGYDTQENWLPGEPGDTLKIPATNDSERSTKYGALMSYYETRRWMSPWEWQYLVDAFDPPALASRQFSALSALQSSIPGLQITGVIYTDNTGSLRPIFQTPSFLNITPPSGPYTVELRGPPPGEPLLYSQSFNVPFEFDASCALFLLNVPFMTGTYSVSLRNSSISPSVLLDKITASANPPQVTITYPNGGETVGDSFNATWVADDLDGDSLTFKLSYSSDNGVSWRPLATGIRGTSYRVDNSMLPGGSQALIRVLASDGFHTSEDQSDSVFNVPLKSPMNVAGIGVGPCTKTYDFGKPIVFKGSAFDPEDGVLQDAALTWASDLDGTLGTGRVFATTDLRPGTHNITLTATDSDGNNVTVSFTITVEFHNVKVAGAVPSKTVVGQGYSLSINVTVENQGNVEETFNVRVYSDRNVTVIGDEVTIGNETVSSLTGGNSTTITLTWNTTGVVKGNYTITAYATPVPYETFIADNTLTDGTLTVVHPGDVNNDCVVDIADVILVTAVYRSKCGEPEFRPNSDIIEDCVIDIADVVAVTSHYRETC